MPYTPLPDPSSEPVAQFSVPLRGTISNTAVNNVPADALYLSNNVFLRKGKLRNRPGLVRYTETTFDNPVLVSAMAVTPLSKIILSITRTTAYELGENDANWSNIGTATYAINDFSVIDLAFIEVASTYVGIIVSEGLPIRAWNSVLHTANIVPFVGITPTAKSVCIAGRRAIYLESPHTVRWSQVFQYNSVTADSYNKLAQTNDAGICVRSITARSFVVYKERSIYTVSSQAGNDESAFNFSEPIEVEGPASIHSVVKTPMGHVYITRSGRIALFDGGSYPQWIADGLWLQLQHEINPEYAYLIHGVYDYRLHTVAFFYPKVGTTGLKGMVLINLPFEGIDIQDQQPGPASFTGECSASVSASCEVRFNRVIDQSLLFAPSGMFNVAYTFDELASNDAGTVFPCSFQTGLQGMPAGKPAFMTAETFVERQKGYGVLNIEPVVADGLESENGTVVDNSSWPVNLEMNPVTEHHAFGIQKRFFGLRYSWQSDSTVRYAGAACYGVAHR